MTITAEKVMDSYPLQIDLQVLRSVLEDTESEIVLYERIVRDFETQWGCDRSNLFSQHNEIASPPSAARNDKCDIVEL